MSFPRYAEYRDSGVEWLGKVPAHWDVVALKRFTTLRSGNGITAEQISEEGEYPVLGGNGIRGYTSAYTHDGYFPVIGRQGALCGNINYGSGRFWASEHAVVAAPVRRLDIYWLGEMLRAMNLNQYSLSAAQPGLSVEVVSNLRTVLPSIEEQYAIAVFLEHKTRKIDDLIVEQQRLIELLKEKRQAVISHAVTRGLNPEAPMKDSGVEWIGDAPMHWRIILVKRLLLSIEQGWSPQCEAVPVESSEEWGILKVGCVNGGTFNPGENKKLPDDLAPVPELTLRAGDLLVSRANTRELVGSAAVVPVDHPNLMLCDKLYRLRVDPAEVDPAFLVGYLATPAARGRIELAATGASASMVNIAQSTILEMPVGLPPVHEQREILRVLRADTADVDGLVHEAERAIALLQERRTAIISAAVTGKIDVRNLVNAEVGAV